MIKGLHGQFEFRLQRFIEPEAGSQATYFELTDQFQAGYISEGLKEMVIYYSNRLSYQAVATLLARLTGQKLLSDQKIQQLAVAKAVEVSHSLAQEVKRVLAEPSRGMPPLNPTVALYEAQAPEILWLDDGIQVKGQKPNRDKQPAQAPPSEPTVAEAPSRWARHNIVRLDQKDGRFAYLTERTDDPGQAWVSLPEVVKSHLIAEYGHATEPLNLVAITDGGRDIRLRLLTIFGLMIPLLLDWYHLGKKVRELMSMIALTKADKVSHLQNLFYFLGRGQTDQALIYLKTNVQAKNEAKRLELIGYLEKHQAEIIDYRRRQQAGKAIGSGRVEKACDQVVAHRQKHNGMSWSQLGSHSLAILRTVELNQRCHNLWPAQPTPG